MVLNFMPESISELKMETDKSKGEIVVYQPDEVTRLEVQVDNETVWLAQEQIAMLFGVKRPAITKHIRNIFATQELEERSVCSILERTASDGKTYMTQFYNLDMILSVGYRVNSKNAVLFRRWANAVLKEYLLKGYAVNNRFIAIENQLKEQMVQRDSSIEELYQENKSIKELNIQLEQEKQDAFNQLEKIKEAKSMQLC